MEKEATVKINENGMVISYTENKTLNQLKQLIINEMYASISRYGISEVNKDLLIEILNKHLI